MLKSFSFRCMHAIISANAFIYSVKTGINVGFLKPIFKIKKKLIWFVYFLKLEIILRILSHSTDILFKGMRKFVYTVIKRLNIYFFYEWYLARTNSWEGFIKYWIGQIFLFQIHSYSAYKNEFNCMYIPLKSTPFN